MFNSGNAAITKVLNPLNITRNSMVEFNIGALKETGLYRFTKIIEFSVGGRSYARYLLYSKVDDTEYVFEAFPGNSGQLETYLYTLTDTVPFSEDFLEVAGQPYLTTPQGNEYTRCTMPECEDRLEGVEGRIKVYNIETDRIEKEMDVQIWDYERDADGTTEFLNIEMSDENGMFRIFTGEIIEDIFYKLYQNSK